MNLWTTENNARSSLTFSSSFCAAEVPVEVHIMLSLAPPYCINYTLFKLTGEDAPPPSRKLIGCHALVSHFYWLSVTSTHISSALHQSHYLSGRGLFANLI